MKWSVRTDARLEAALKQLSGDNEELPAKNYKTYLGAYVCVWVRQPFSLLLYEHVRENYQYWARK